ncbi:type II toxin-antitoxin system PemK/MazF family toxin [Candidatus Woesearchaeota archaeon]|nr:type II toxin-antitoxin system PemK/MazF family toxin [Candidatus Woesearchaeota archaeon]
MEEIPLIFKQRDIILVPFPFSDQKGGKIRPAIIISNNKLNKTEDIIVSAITSNIKPSPYSINIKEKDLEIKNIKEECCIKVENLLRVKKTLILKKIDSLREEAFTEVIERARNLF